MISVMWYLCACVAGAAPTHLVDETPIKISEMGDDVILVDFGKVAFGNIRLTPPSGANGSIVVYFGEAQKRGRIDRNPPGTVRFNQASVELRGQQSIVVAPPADKRNTQINSKKNPPAILTPKEWGVVLPFRWVEIKGWPGTLKPDHIVRQSAYATTWDDNAARFESSDAMLNQIWELCRYSIKATTFAGVYVDGDRERIPYEADSYLNQLSHYYTDNDTQMARDTIDHLLQHPTWPTEWGPHMVFMVHADHMHTGDVDWLASRYELLKSKLLLERRGEDNLVASNQQQIKRTDIVDWPRGERDGYQFTSRNTVINAFHLRCLEQMEDLARALGKGDEAEDYARLFVTGHAAFQEAFFDHKTGLYNDGIDTNHQSLHANLFPLAFDLAPVESREAIANWLAERGMQCSVYPAQYLMEGLFENGAASQAIALKMADNDRSWRHMVESGTTITWEAWDQKYKRNQDWNHAWGAAPANILPRYVIGAQPLVPGWSIAQIRPHPGDLEYAKGTVPTPMGPILIHWLSKGGFDISIKLPEGMAARIELPAFEASRGVTKNGKPVAATRVADHWVLADQLHGNATFKVEQ